MKEVGLTRDSEEIKVWINKVRKFYEEILDKMFKYFELSLKTKTLHYMGVLCPSVTLSLSLDELKTRWKYLAERQVGNIWLRSFLMSFKLLKWIP